MTAPQEYPRLAARLAADAFITDAWLDGQPRFGTTPMLLPRDTYGALAAAAEGVAGTLDELCRIVAGAPELLDQFFRLTPVQRLMFETSFPLWHGHARADVFLRHDGTPVVCEMNCDTPSGHPEAIALNQIALRSRETNQAVDLVDPCSELPAAIARLVAAVGGRITRARPTVGIVYPTELTEDLALITLWRTTLEARGHRVVLGSPFNLHATADGGVALFGAPVDVIVRHYKADWWGEREPLWHDEAPYPDPKPLAAQLRLLLEAQLRGRVFVVNPFGAVLPQNKRAFAFLWEHRARFSPQGQAVIDAYVPYTMRLEAADSDELRADRAGWVLKSDYGCEGEEVLIGAAMTDPEWHEALTAARAHRWIAQRRFEAARDSDGRATNHGVFLVAGRTTGVYARVSPHATDRRSLSAPMLIVP